MTPHMVTIIMTFKESLSASATHLIHSWGICELKAGIFHPWRCPTSNSASLSGLARLTRVRLVPLVLSRQNHCLCNKPVPQWTAALLGIRWGRTNQRVPIHFPGDSNELLLNRLVFLFPQKAPTKDGSLLFCPAPL